MIARTTIGAICLLILSGLAAAQPAPGASEAPYPGRPIRLIVPYPPGGSGDVVARLIAPNLSSALGQSFVVENQAGAAGLIGHQQVAKAAPDGYTLVLGLDPLIIIPSLRASMPYDPIRDFAPISQLASLPFVLVVSPTVPVSSVKDLIALAKSKPGSLNYASSGPGSQTQLAAEQFKGMTGTNLVNVPYKGTAAATVDLLSGQVHVMFTGISSILPHINAGRVKALAVGSNTRSALLPAVPTFAEAGVPGFTAATWMGVLAPAKTPAAVITRLNREFANVMALPAIKERLAAMGADPVTNSPQEFATMLQAEKLRWAKVIKDANITLD